MRTWLVCAAMLAVGCTEKTPNTPGGTSPPSAAPASISGPAGPVLMGLERAVGRCKKAGGSPHNIQRCTAYRRYLGKVRRMVGEYSPELPRSVEPFLARMKIGFDRLGDADPWTRAGALGVVELGLVAAQYKPSEHTKGWLDRLVTRASESKDANERVALLRVVGNHAAKDQQAGLLALAQSADAVGVRAAAWAALARCSERGCSVTAEQLEAAWAKETSPKARGGLALLAGWIHSPKTAEWCAPLLEDRVAGPSCRAALKRMGDDAAYALLSARADRLVAAATPPGDEHKDALAASALADLTPVATLPVAGVSVYTRLGAFMEGARHPQAMLRVAGQLLFMKDRARARALAQTQLDRVKDDTKMTLVANRLRRVVSALSDGEPGKGDGHDHGEAGHDHGKAGHDHDHAGHDHDHAGHDHDHAGHDQAGHDHGRPGHNHGEAGHTH